MKATCHIYEKKQYALNIFIPRICYSETTSKDFSVSGKQSHFEKGVDLTKKLWGN